MIHATGIKWHTSFFRSRILNGNRTARNFSQVMIKRFIKDARTAVFCTKDTRRHIVWPKIQLWSKTYKSKVTNGIQNTVISRSDTTRLRVDKFEEFRRFEEKRMAIRMGILPSSDIATMENSEKTIKSSSPLANVHAIEKHTARSLEPLAVELFMPTAGLKVSVLQATDLCGLFSEYRYAMIPTEAFEGKSSTSYANRRQEVTVGESQERLTYILPENNTLQTEHNYLSSH